MTQTYSTFFNALFILINFDVYNYYIILATLTAELKTFIVTYVKNCMIEVSLPVRYAHFFCIDLDARTPRNWACCCFSFRRTYKISTFIRAASEGPQKNKTSFSVLFSYKAAPENSG